jgi:hypothetical protein
MRWKRCTKSWPPIWEERMAKESLIDPPEDIKDAFMRFPVSSLWLATEPPWRKR